MWMPITSGIVGIPSWKLATGRGARQPKTSKIRREFFDFDSFRLWSRIYPDRISLTHSLVDHRRWRLATADRHCLSSPLLPVLWQLLQLNAAATTPLFYVVHPLSFGSSLVTKTIYIALQDGQCQISCTSVVTRPKYCSFIRASAPSPLTPFPYQSLLILICWYCVLSKKFRASFSSTTSQKTRFYFYPISLMPIPLHHTETAQTIHFITLNFNADVTFLSFQMVVSSTAFWRAIAIRLFTLLISLVQSPSADM